MPYVKYGSVICVVLVLLCGFGYASRTASSKTSETTDTGSLAGIQTAENSVPDKALMQTLLAEMLSDDYSDLVEQCTYYPLYSDSSTAPSDIKHRLAICSSRVGHDFPDREFTDRERRRLGVQVLPDGHTFSLIQLDTLLIAYYRKFGVLPANGTEFFENYVTCGDEKMLLDCLNMTREQRFSRLAPLINPATGRLYASLNATQWEPFGICAEIVPRERWDTIRPGFEHTRIGYPDITNGAAPQVMFHIVHYGEQPGSVIEDLVTGQP